MKVVVAKTAGFCFGVKRAVDTVYEQAARAEENEKEKPIYTYGPIIHNEEVVRDLEEKGVRVLNSEEEIGKLSGGTVIIRSHGDVYKRQIQSSAAGRIRPDSETDESRCDQEMYRR